MALPRLIPLDELFANAEFSGASISPDGERIAYLAPYENRTNVFVRGVDEEHADAIRVTSDKRRGIKTYYWTDDPRWMLYLQDTDGNEDWHLYRVDLENLDAPAVDLTPLEPGGRVMAAEPMRGMPGTFLVSMNKRLTQFDYFLINIATGETTVHFENDDALGGYVLGPNDSLFYTRMDLEGDGAYEFYSVDPETREKRLLTRETGTDYPLGIAPGHITSDGKGWLMGLYHNSDQLALVRIDAETGEKTVVCEEPGRSICIASMVAPLFPASLIISRRTGDVLAVRFVGDRPLLKAMDADFAPLLEKLGSLCEGGEIAGVSSDKEERRWVVSFLHDTDPGQTYFYDAETGESRLLFRSFANLDPADLAPMKGVSFQARDGLPMHGFLTLPQGVDPTGLPLVIAVHGGPWFHDIWMYNPIIQFFANRGYAVLQINFRGSSGYGRTHTTAAIKEFAGKMHDDLIDGAEWAVKQGIADPARIGIYGGSYGGYSALVGVTVTPDFFAAAVDYVGISSWHGFLTTIPAFVRPGLRNSFGAYLGDPDVPEELADMMARSPITMVDKIVTPLLVVQGANDARVVQAEADNIVAALRERGVDVEYILASDEGHGFQNPENLEMMYRSVERHFGQYLGGRTAESNQPA